MREIIKKPWFIWSAVGLFFIIGFLKKDFDDKRTEKLLDGKTKTIKVVLHYAQMGFNSGFYVGCKFKINNAIEEVLIGTRHNFLQIGDTILIKYSVEDPILVEIVDPCYMQKHKGKSYCK